MKYKSELSNRLEKIAGLVLTSVHLGIEEKNAKPNTSYGSSYKYLQDNWNVTISYNGKEYTSSYISGIGNRKLIRSVKKERNRYYNSMWGEFKTELEACKAQWLKLVDPDLTDVMSCLLNDGRSAEGTFEDFAGEFGYDTDSRKALEIYLTCQVTRGKMINMLGLELFEELCGLEH